MWARFTFITGPWVRLVLLPGPWTPPCNVPGIRCSGIVGFSVYTCVFSQTLKQGADCFTTRSRERCCSHSGWEAFAFWVLRELRAGRGIYQHEQNIVISASWDTLNSSGFLRLVSWLLVCSRLILGHFLGRMEVWVLLCPTWSARCELWLDTEQQRAVVGQGSSERRCQQRCFFSSSAAELSGQKDGFWCRPLVLMSVIHTVLLCAWSGDGSGPCVEEVEEIYEHNSPAVDLVGYVIPFAVTLHKVTALSHSIFWNPYKLSARHVILLVTATVLDSTGAANCFLKIFFSPSLQ